MKRFQFAEQTLLSVREQERDIAEIQVMRARQAVNTIETEIRTLLKWLSDRVELLATNSGASTDAVKTRHAVGSIERAHERLAHCHVELDSANGDLDLAREALLMKEVAVKSLETLKKHRWAVYQKIQQSKRQQLLDESTLRVWINQRHEATDV